MFAHAALEVFRHDMMTLAHLPIGASEAYGSSSDCSMARLIQRERKREREIVNYSQPPRADLMPGSEGQNHSVHPCIL